MIGKALAYMGTDSVTGEEKKVEVTVLQFLGSDIGLVRAVCADHSGAVIVRDAHDLRMCSEWPSELKVKQEAQTGKKGGRNG